jgi:adenylylsulfate kinase-like enzyme
MYNNLSDEGENVNIFTLSDRGVSLSKNTLASIVRSQMQARGVDASQLDSDTPRSDNVKMLTFSPSSLKLLYIVDHNCV